MSSSTASQLTRFRSCHKHTSQLKGTNCPAPNVDIWHLNNDGARGPSWLLSWKMLPFGRDTSGSELFPPRERERAAAVYFWRRCSLEMSRISGKCWNVLWKRNVCFVNKMRFLSHTEARGPSGATGASQCVFVSKQTSHFLCFSANFVLFLILARLWASLLSGIDRT